MATIPGSDGAIEGEEQLAKEAAKIGFPLILKAVAGGAHCSYGHYRDERKEYDRVFD